LIGERDWFPLFFEINKMFRNDNKSLKNNSKIKIIPEEIRNRMFHYF